MEGNQQNRGQAKHKKPFLKGKKTCYAQAQEDEHRFVRRASRFISSRSSIGTQSKSLHIAQDLRCGDRFAESLDMLTNCWMMKLKYIVNSISEDTVKPVAKRC